MATLVLGVVGAAAGSLVGQAPLGFAIGAQLGSLFGPRQKPQQVGRIEEFHIPSSSYGTTIPLVYSQGRVAGNVIWRSAIRESSRTRRVGGKNFSSGKQTIREYSYSCSLAILWCEGPVENIRRIWGGDKLIWDQQKAPPTQYLIQNYFGTEDQPVDPTLEAVLGEGLTPAYRGRCYTVIQDFLLDDFGKAIPPFSAEIACEVAGHGLVIEDLVSFWQFNPDPGYFQDTGPDGYHLTPGPFESPGLSQIITNVLGRYETGVECYTLLAPGGTYLNYAFTATRNFDVEFTAMFWVKYVFPFTGFPDGGPCGFYYNGTHLGGTTVEPTLGLFVDADSPGEGSVAYVRYSHNRATPPFDWMSEEPLQIAVDFGKALPEFQRPWRHIAFTFKPQVGSTPGRWRLYQDGELQQEVATSLTTIGQNPAVNMGLLFTTTESFRFDDVGCASRELTEEEIRIVMAEQFS